MYSVFSGWLVQFFMNEMNFVSQFIALSSLTFDLWKGQVRDLLTLILKRKDCLFFGKLTLQTKGAVYPSERRY
jgi:hypothetical protein